MHNKYVKNYLKIMKHCNTTWLLQKIGKTHNSTGVDYSFLNFFGCFSDINF